MQLAELLPLVGTGVGVAGLGFGLYQYAIGQKWKRAEFAARELARLHAEPELALCCTLLDWSARRLAVPPAYAELTEDSTFVHTWDTLHDAMQPEAVRGEFPWPEIIYRDAFDRLFTYLASIENFLRTRLIDRSHVEPLEYWLREIASPRFARNDGKDVLLVFLRTYEYKEVLRLMERFRIPTGAASPTKD